MFDKLAGVEARYAELEQLLADPEIALDYEKVAGYAQERAELEHIVSTYRTFKETLEEIQGARTILDEEEDQELKALAVEELQQLEAHQAELEDQLKQMLLPKDPRDAKNVIIEIRAGAGGDEAGLFAANLHRMYVRYAEKQGWRTDMISFHDTGVGGFKEVVFEVAGKGAFSRFKYESGVHRVQRVPITESQGRIHTSTATIAVLPEVDAVEIDIDPKDLDIAAYGASGPGGQHMQKNATAIRITHIPTGMVVSCENQRSQAQNRIRAMSVLRARLYEAERSRQNAKIDASRRAQVGSGERSEKIRTYNFPQNRVTDHRINLTLYRLSNVLEGDLDELIDEMATREQAEKLQAE